jgi:UDP-N-acetylbacillosamine N-acetyltransferase
MRDIVIVGAGGHARVVLDVIRRTDKFNARGFVDTVNLDRHGTMHDGLPVLGGEEMFEQLFSDGVEYAVVGFGDIPARQRFAERLTLIGYTLATLVHPTAIIANGVSIGAGTVIFAGAIINPGSYIGSNVIINTAATIDHDCVIQDHAHIALGVRLAGHVTVGERSLIGVGAVVRPHIKIANDVTVGAGAAVVDDVPRGVTVVGVPARPIA